MSDYISIKDWNEEDKPREKLIEKGAEALTNPELLAILINTGTKSRSALQIAQEVMLMAKQNLLELQQLHLNEIKSIKGLGPKKAVTLLAAIELGKRLRLAKANELITINNSQSSFELMLPYFSDFGSEQTVVMFLNQNHKCLHIKRMSEGGLTSTIMDPRKIFSLALTVKGATRIIIAHNHPSGNLQPSQADRAITQKLIEAGKLLDIKILDHLIIGHNAYLSFADEALMSV